MKVPFVDLDVIHRPIIDEIYSAMRRVIENSDFILGEDVARFEEEFASYCAVEYAVGVDSGLAALELILRGYGIGQGDEVIVPTFTFVATAAAVAFAGARPVLVDVDPLTYCIDVAQTEAALTPRTRGIIAVHLYGQPAEMDELNRLAERNGLIVIEDACQAHGATYKGRKVGSLGNAAAFSFYPSKNLGGFGDGGMVVTSDGELAERVRMMRNCGQRTKNVHEGMPFNHRLDTLQAAVLRSKLRFLDGWNESRRQIARGYGRLLEGASVVAPLASPEVRHVYHLYVVRSSSRDRLQAHLREHEIGSAIHYPTPIHLQPFFKDRGFRKGQFPVAEMLAGEVISLPMYPSIPGGHVQLVAEAIHAYWDDPALVEDLVASGHGPLGAS
jgi:dTDP-4-amino-4,6-dideoxygalactose transaminase